jgi:hypothetical protein
VVYQGYIVKKKLILILLFFCTVFSGVFSQTQVQPEDYIDSGYAGRLRSSGSHITETQLRNPVLKLMPRHTSLRNFVEEARKSVDPNLIVETLYLYKKPTAAGAWNDVQRTGLFNQMLALSTLTGIQYYSESRKTMRTFYESSMVIDSPESKRPLPDPVYSAPLSSLSIYARQKDLTFGDNIYRYDYRTTGDAFIFLQENMTALSAGIIPAVGRNKLQSVMAVIDCEDYLLIYAVSMARVVSVFGMGDRISNSFSNRANAILQWFTAGVDRIFL